MNDIEIAKMKIDYGKFTSAFFLSILGGQIALLGSVFKDYDSKWLAFVSIALLLLSSIGSLTVSEITIRELAPKPEFTNRFILKIIGLVPCSTSRIYLYSTLSGIFGFISVSCYLIFVWMGI